MRRARLPAVRQRKAEPSSEAGQTPTRGIALVLPPRPTQPDHLWTMDFASDAFTSGRKFRTLNLMDGFTREALEIHKVFRMHVMT